MYYLREFKVGGDYEAYASSGEFLTPNISYIEESNETKYNPLVIAPPVAPVAPIGASIYGLDGKFYSVDEWTSSGKSNSDAVGVAVSNGEHSFVIHPTAEQASLKWSSNMDVVVDGVVTVEDHLDDAMLDFAGEANTTAILAAVQAGTIEDAPAAQYCAGITFANGKIGYLPSAGEITLAYGVLSDINSCLTSIGGTQFDMNSKFYWSSTQYSYDYACYWYYNAHNVGCNTKKSYYSARVVSSL